VSFGRQIGFDLSKEPDVELSTARELLVMGLLVIALLGVMWLLAVTRQSPD